MQVILKGLSILMVSFSEVYYSDGGMLERATNYLWHSKYRLKYLSSRVAQQSHVLGFDILLNGASRKISGTNMKTSLPDIEKHCSESSVRSHQLWIYSSYRISSITKVTGILRYDWLLNSGIPVFV